MPTLREYPGLAINEWQVSELESAYSVKVHPSNAHHPLHLRSKSGAGDTEWYGGIATDEQARAILTEGWQAGADRLTRIASEITPPTVKTRRRVGTWRDDGDELGVDRAMRGDWDRAWRTTRREWSQGPSTIDLIAMFGGSAAESAESLFWNGAVAAVISNVLESAGYSTSITGCFLHAGKGTTYDHSLIGRTDIVIKAADEPLRIDALASLICHAGIFRTYVFQALMSLPFQLGLGLGPAIYHWTDENVQRMRDAGELSDGAVVLKTCYSRQDAEREIARVLSLVSGGES